MRIGIVIGRIGGVDGVALETEKWVTVLKRLGHEVIVLTGDLEAHIPGVMTLPELGFSHPATQQEQEDAFFAQDVVEADLERSLRHRAAVIERGVENWLIEQRIELLITQNCTTLPCHLAMGMALKRIIERTGIRTIAHDHDFYWERGDRYTTRYDFVRDVIEECFPPDLPNMTHVVINSHCRDSLQRQLGVEAHLIPNVMDFEDGFGAPDDFNSRLPDELGLAADTIPLFQVTRIVRRKGIETAIDLVERLDDSRIKLILTGDATDDHNHEYLDELEARAARLPRPDQVMFSGDRFANDRVRSNGSGPVFSLSDAYAHARGCTYFSHYEGFGNAFVEALVARVPIFVNNYIPVYWPDIGSKGFRTVQIEDSSLTDDAIDDIRLILTDDDLRAEIAEHNFELGRQHFSYEVLADLLAPLVAD